MDANQRTAQVQSRVQDGVSVGLHDIDAAFLAGWPLPQPNAGGAQTAPQPAASSNAAMT